MSDATKPELEDLPYEELRDRAFKRAEHHADLRFFVDLMEHTAALNATATEGGSLGDIGGSISDTIVAARQAFAKDVPPDLEPLFRARFATYLREHGG